MSEQSGKNLAREINETIRFTSWTVFRRTQFAEHPEDCVNELLEILARAESEDIQLRGIYDVSGMRANADLMFWFHAPRAEQIQAVLREIKRSALGHSLESVWAAMALHRPAEFNKGHVPAFMAGAPARDWLCVYPFVRSYEWYLLPEEERRALLVEHGMAGRDFTGILSNTVASFALGDYEWILALESNDLPEIVDLMRDLRSTKARLHVREEIPFYTGRRIEPSSIGDLIS
ncbi:MAG: chlorite dismutase family protein [Actinobacteria bacterium]|nr:chlorite dismutase family protein [Nitrospirota bacterium]MBI3430477.1 chlorite dismutase family protein [Actinomycetota bacterium]